MKRTVFIFYWLFCSFIFVAQAEKVSSLNDLKIVEEDSSSVIQRPVTGSYNIEIGKTFALATYLSPLRYKGTEFKLSGEWSKAMPFNPSSAIMRFKGGIGFNNLLNPSQTARMVGFDFDFSWGMEWRRRFPGDWQVTTGGQAGIEGGALYLLRNGNNPVEALANFSIGITGSAGKVIKAGKLDLLLSDQVTIPSIGAFFCPEYGETYYEIYLGNRKNLAHFGWWGNNFRLNNLLSLTFDLGRTALSLGYRFKVYTQWANNLNTTLYTHSFVIGIIPGGIGLKTKHQRRLNYSIY